MKTFDRPFLLELGAGYRPTPGYVHNDIYPQDDIEIVCRAEDIGDYVDTPIDILRATHLLEHFSYRETANVLKRWYDAMAPEGEIYLEVPNFSWQTKAHAFGEISDEEAVNYIFGEQDYEGNFHFNGFTIGSLTKYLTDAGFNNLSVYSIGQVICARGRK